MQKILWLLSLGAAIASACEDSAPDAPSVTLAVGSQVLGPAPTVTFAATPVGTNNTSVLTITNNGPGTLTLTGTPPLQVEDDDRLAFRVTPPPKLRLSVGEHVEAAITFSPTAIGAAHGTLVIPIANGPPLTVELAGEGSPVPSAALELSIDGQPVTDHFDCGLVEPNASTNHGLLLRNTGTAPLQFASGSALVIIGADADAFTVAALPAQGLAAGASVEVALTCAPRACHPQIAELTIAFDDPGTPLRRVALTASTAAAVQSYAAFAGADLPFPTVHDVTISGPRATGGYVVALGDQARSAEAGQVRTTVWNGCTITLPPEAAGPGALNLTTTRLGTQVSASDDGRSMLVSALDVASAWILDLDANGRPSLRARLATFEPGEGQGRSAQLSGNGTLAVIGNPLADSQWVDHGAMLLYSRLGDSWSNYPEALLRLEPSRRDETVWLGTSVQVSRDGTVVASGALQTAGPGRIPDGDATAVALVYEYTTAGGSGVWGLPGGPTVEPFVREETVRLTTDAIAHDNSARIAMSADGTTIGIAVRRNDKGIDVHLFARVSGAWNVDTNGWVRASHVLQFGEAGEWTMALAPDATFLIVGDNAGIREYARGDTWAVAAGARMTWEVPLAGPLALSPDGKVIAGMDTHGGAWLVSR